MCVVVVVAAALHISLHREGEKRASEQMYRQGVVLQHFFNLSLQGPCAAEHIGLLYLSRGALTPPRPQSSNTVPGESGLVKTSAFITLTLPTCLKVRVEDPTIFLLHRCLCSSGQARWPCERVRVTIQPALLQVDAPLVSWIVDYVTRRPQYVGLQGDL